MAALQVKPTRMELSNLKKKKKVAVRGHKLMKDKRDEMVRRFIIYVRRNKELREQVEEKLGQAMQSFVLARAGMGNADIEEALCSPARPAINPSRRPGRDVRGDPPALNPLFYSR